MSRSQAFVSQFLTHFVGRRFMDPDSPDFMELPQREEQQYEILATILRSGHLDPDPNAPGGGGGWYSVGAGAGEELTSNEMFSVSALCFCDIPIGDLGVHMQKYGSVGLAFPKPFLVQWGANPVFYVAINSRSRVSAPDAQTRRDYFNKMIAQYSPVRAFVFSGGTEPGAEDEDLHAIFRKHPSLRADPAMERLCRRLGAITEFFDADVLGYVKCFEDGLPVESVENFYMEREWRVGRRVDFKLSEVGRVIVPRRLVPRLRREFPDLPRQRVRPAEDCSRRWWKFWAWWTPE